MNAPKASSPVRNLIAVKQSIFRGTAKADGARVEFVSLADDRCALLRNGDLIAAWGSDAYGINDGVLQFLQITDSARPRPFSRARTRGAPKAGHDVLAARL
jgi:hypothetical protein